MSWAPERSLGKLLRDLVNQSWGQGKRSHQGRDSRWEGSAQLHQAKPDFHQEISLLRWLLNVSLWSKPKVQAIITPRRKLLFQLLQESKQGILWELLSQTTQGPWWWNAQLCPAPMTDFTHTPNHPRQYTCSSYFSTKYIILQLHCNFLHKKSLLRKVL